jgi:hypothetical protein
VSGVQDSNLKVRLNVKCLMFLVGVDVRYKIILKQMKAELMLLDSKNKLK